jgi:hypothetical protein
MARQKTCGWDDSNGAKRQSRSWNPKNRHANRFAATPASAQITKRDDRNAPEIACHGTWQGCQVTDAAPEGRSRYHRDWVRLGGIDRKRARPGRKITDHGTKQQCLQAQQPAPAGGLYYVNATAAHLERRRHRDENIRQIFADQWHAENQRADHDTYNNGILNGRDTAPIRP